MKTFTMKRGLVAESGAWSLLSYDGQPVGVTLERTYKHGDLWLPKIPTGLHVCHLDMFNAGGYPTYEIPVLNHTEIKFHIGNWVTDSKGCPLVGSGIAFNEQTGLMIVSDSSKAFHRFMELASPDALINLLVE